MLKITLTPEKGVCKSSSKSYQSSKCYTENFKRKGREKWGIKIQTQSDAKEIRKKILRTPSFLSYLLFATIVSKFSYAQLRCPQNLVSYITAQKQAIKFWLLFDTKGTDWNQRPNSQQTLTAIFCLPILRIFERLSPVIGETHVRNLTASQALLHVRYFKHAQKLVHIRKYRFF